jgi:hypothetical protein
MAKVHFAPNCAVKYVGAKAKDFATSLARPKPRLARGDIVIVDKKTAFNLVQKGFGEFEQVESIAFNKAEAMEYKSIEELEASLEEHKAELARMIEINEKLEQINSDLIAVQIKEDLAELDAGADGLDESETQEETQEETK